LAGVIEFAADIAAGATPYFEESRLKGKNAAAKEKRAGHEALL